MHTKESIEKFMTEYGYKPSSCKAEVKVLPNLLQPDETLHALLEGQFRNVHGKGAASGYGLVIATNQRILSYRKSIIGTVTQEEIPMSQITATSFRKGLMFASVMITTANNESIAENCIKSEAEKFVKVVQNLLSQVNKTSTPPQQSVSNLDQLEKLFELKQKGIITEDEFIAQKAKLLQSN